MMHLQKGVSQAMFLIGVTFLLYTVVEKKALTAGKVFSSIAVFDLIREQLHQVNNA